MNTTILGKVQIAVLTLLCMLGFAIAVPASADHGDEAEVTTHATTAHEHDDKTLSSTVTVVSANSEVARLQKLVTALQQLVDLLKKKAELEHDATPHEHDDEDSHDDKHNNEDHD